MTKLMDNQKCTCGATMECAGFTYTGVSFVCNSCHGEMDIECVDCATCQFASECEMKEDMA